MGSNYLHLCCQHMHMYTCIYGYVQYSTFSLVRGNMLRHPKVVINKNSLYVYIVLCTNVCVYCAMY